MYFSPEAVKAAAQDDEIDLQWGTLTFDTLTSIDYMILLAVYAECLDNSVTPWPDFLDTLNI